MEKETSTLKDPIKTSSWLWQVIILLLALCVGLSIYLKITSKTLYTANKRQAALMTLGYDLEERSDYLTSQARSFAVTSNIKYLKNYWDEVLLYKNRDNIIDKIKTYSNNPQERQLLIDSKRNSDELINTEIRSMKLILSVYNIPNEMLPLPIQSYRLNKKDTLLNSQKKIAQAQKILFDSTYNINKQSIIKPVEKYNELVSAHLRKTLMQSERKVQLSNILLILLLALSLAFSVGSLWTKYKLASQSGPP